jgi:predicted deacylase
MMGSDVLEIAGLAVRRGEERRGSLALVELADGSVVRAPLRVLRGSSDGPRLYLGAAIHGDEANGVAILARALAAVRPAALRGDIVCVPVQHPLAFTADHRLPLAPFLKSPLDQVPSDAWTCFPGDRAGNIAQIVAAALFGLIRRCDYAIDVHTPTRGGRYVPIAILPHPSLGEAALRAERLATAMGTGWVMNSDRGMYVADGILCVEATRAGVPSFTFEIGEGGRLEERSVEEGARCILNALKALDMIDGAPTPLGPTRTMRAFVGLRAQRGGLLTTHLSLGAAAEKGDRLCTIHDVFGELVETIVAPEPGFFVRATTMSTVSQGERVATLGIL